MDEELDQLTPEQLDDGILDIMTGIQDSTNQLGTTSSNIDTVENIFLNDDLDNYTDYISKDGFRGDASQIDYMRANNQGWGEQLVRGFISRGLSIIPKVGQGLGHFGGLVYDGVSMLGGDGQFEKTYDNAFVDAMSKMDEDLRKWLPVYATQDYTEGNILQQMGTMKFWADDAFDGVAFMASAMVPGTVVGKVGQAAGMSAKALNFAQVGVGTVYNTVTEAGFEAHGVNKSVKEALLAQGYDEATAKERAAVAAKNTFLANMVVLAGPNLLQSTFFHGNPLRNSQKLRQDAIHGKVNPEDFKSFKSRVGKGFAEGFLSEGVWEENIQTAIQNWEQHAAMTDEDEGFMDTMSGYAHEWMKNFTTTEGQKAIILGGIIGGPASARRAYLDYKADKANVAEGAKIRTEELQRLESIASMYEANKKAFVNEDGSINNDQLINLVQQTFRDKRYYDQATAFTLANNKKGLDLINNMALARKAFASFDSIAFENIDAATEYIKTPMELIINDEQLAASDPELIQEVNANIQKVDAYKELYSKADSQIADTNEFDPNNPEQMLVADVMKKNLYHQYVKQDTLLKMQSESENAEKYEDALKDTENAIKELESRKGRKALLKEYDSLFQSAVEADRKVTEASTPTEKAEASYLAEETKAIFGEFNPLNQATDESARANAEPGMMQQLAMDAGHDAYRRFKLEEAADKYLADENSIDGVNEILNSFVFRPDTNAPELTEQLNKVVNKARSEASEFIKNANAIRAVGQGFPTQDELDIAQELMDDPNSISEATQKAKEFQNSGDRMNNIADAIQQKVLERDGNKATANEIYINGRGNPEVFKRLFAEKKYKAYERIESLFTRESDEFADVDGARRTLVLLKAIKANISDETDSAWTTNFKGFMQHSNFVRVLDRAIAKLENTIIPQAMKNRDNRYAKQLALAQMDYQINYKGIGVHTIQGGIAEDRYVSDMIRSSISSEVFEQVLNEPRHNVRLELIKKHAVDPGALISDLEWAKDKYIEDLAQLRVTDRKINPTQGLISKYRSNPEKIFTEVFNKATVGKNYDNGFNKTPAGVFTTNRSLPELLLAFQNSTETGSKTSKAELGLILQLHTNIVGLDRMIRDLKSSYDHLEQLKQERLLSAKNVITPTIQQTKAIRDLVKWYKSPANKPDEAKGNTSYLQGPAGTGKTKVVFKWFADSLGLRPNQITTMAHNPIAAGNIQRAIGSPQAIVVEDFINDASIPSEVKLIVVDEVNALTSSTYTSLMESLARVNRGRVAGDKVKILLMGDPTQIRQEKTGFIPIEITELGNELIRVIDPLTIPYRSDVAPINDAGRAFQNNFSPVEELITQANDEIGSIAKGVHIGRSPVDIQNQLAASEGSGRTRVVVVTDANAKQRYQGIPNIEVMTYVEVQGLTFDEVYIDLDPTKFKSPNRLNTAYYTSISRASTYVMMLTDNTNIEHTVEDIIDDGAERYKQEVLDNKQRFVDNNSFEQEVMGQEVVVEESELEVIPETEFVDEEDDLNFPETPEEQSFEDPEALEELQQLEDEIFREEEVMRTVKRIDKDSGEFAERIKQRLNGDPELDLITLESVEDTINLTFDGYETDLKNAVDDPASNEEVKNFVSQLKDQFMADILGDALHKQRYRSEEIAEDEVVRDDTSKEAPDAGAPVNTPIPTDEPDNLHRLKFPEYASIKKKFENPDEPQNGQEVVYVREKETNGDGSRVGIYMKTADGKWDRLGVMGTTELETHPSIKAKLEEGNTRARYNARTRALNYPPATILAQGTVELATPLQYHYGEKPTKIGEGLTDYLKRSLRPALDNGVNSTMGSVRYKIFTTNDPEIKSLREVNKSANAIVPGMPYAIVNVKFTGGRTTPQIIRLQPRRLKKDDALTMQIRSFYDGMREVDNAGIIYDGRKLSYGDPEISYLMKRFVNNFELKDGKVVRKTNDTFRYADARHTMKGALTQQQFNILNKAADKIIPGYYGAGEAKMNIDGFKQLIESEGGKYEWNDRAIINKIVDETALSEPQVMILLSSPSSVFSSFLFEGNPGNFRQVDINRLKKALKIKKEFLAYTVEQNGKTYELMPNGTVKVNGEFMTTPVMSPRKGTAQKALNNLVRANNFVGDTNLRVTYDAITPKGVKRRTYANDLLPQYDQQTKYEGVLQEIALAFVDAVIDDPKGSRPLLQGSGWSLANVNKINVWAMRGQIGENVKEVEKFVNAIANDDLYTEMLKLQDGYNKDITNSEMLEDIVGDNNFDENGFHMNDKAWDNSETGESGQSSYLRLPLEMNDFREHGGTEKGHKILDKMLSTNLVTANPTTAVVRFKAADTIEADPSTAPLVPETEEEVDIYDEIDFGFDDDLYNKC